MSTGSTAGTETDRIAVVASNDYRINALGVTNKLTGSPLMSVLGFYAPPL
jgi:hypothetical protein